MVFKSVFFNWIWNHFPRFFWPFLFLTLGLAIYMRSDEGKLVTPQAPHDIRSLEMPGTDSNAEAIVYSWEKIKLIETAKKDLKLDIVFIFLYVALGLICITGLFARVHINKNKTNTNGRIWIFIGLVVVMAICDFVEDYGMWGYLYKSPKYTPEAPLYTIFSMVKFGIFIFLAFVFLPVMLFLSGQLKDIALHIEGRVIQAWNYRVIVFGLVFWTVPIWILAQGQDLLVNINTSGPNVFLFLLTITVFGLLIWYLSKLFFLKSDF